MRNIVLAGALAIACCGARAQDLGNPDACRLSGGFYFDCEAAARRAVLSRVPVPLRDGCASGCTMQLIARRVCVIPGARIGFHAAVDRSTSQIAPKYTEALAGFYYRYPRLSRRLARDGALNATQIRWYRAEDLNADGVPYCEE